ncbi:MAG: gamma-glutamyl-phosphate reductase, partial [bacterium]
MNAKELMLDIGQKARIASRTIANASPGDKNNALQIAASKLRKSEGLLLMENEKDIQGAKKNGLSSAMIDRLRLTQERIEEMALAVEEIVSLPDPVGEVTKI